jgi:hypothetical protein
MIQNINRGSAPNDPTAEELYSAFGKINANNTEYSGLITPLADLKYNTGWCWFVDNQYTVSSPLVIASGATSVLTNNSNTVDSIRFKAKSSDVNGKFNIFLDLGTGAVPLIANQKTEIFAFGANAQQFFTMELNYFAGVNLMSNNGIIYIESTLGITSIYDIDFLITLDHTPF